MALFKSGNAALGVNTFARLAPVADADNAMTLQGTVNRIAFQALVLTFGILSALLTAYTTRLIRVAENFKPVIVSATGGIAAYHLISFVLSFFGVRAPHVRDNSWLGIGFTLVVVFIAALNLVVGCDFMEKGVKSGAPKYMEWYAASASL
jgi:uncharacterized YccA/Bax inhibitor family protein